jgi:DNA helicase-2/ATP-dependent DNA helicase PcrA
LVQHGQSTGKGLWHAMQHGGPNIDLPPAARAGVQSFVDTFVPLARELKHAGRGALALTAQKLFDALGLKQSIIDADESPNVTTKRMENLAHVAKALERFEGYTEAQGPLLTEFLRVSALTRNDTEVENEDEKRGKVTLMTLHSAKGLEFPYVFLVGVEEELLPHKRTIETGLDFGEERRLCYVGMTRAKRQLWLTYAKTRMRYGRLEPRTPSRFLDELPEPPIIEHRDREVPVTEEAADAKADEFFAKMRATLGIEE